MSYTKEPNKLISCFLSSPPCIASTLASDHATKVMLTKTVEYRIPIFIVKKRIRSQIARGSAELAILALLDEQPLYGFEISKRIDERTSGALHFTLASLYPMLYDIEKRGLIAGHWQSNQAGRDRRYYSLTPAGKKQLMPLRQEWRGFFQALDQLAGVSHA
jgi:PadR family transcriptional regulator, regulatory protein PadR